MSGWNCLAKQRISQPSRGKGRQVLWLKEEKPIGSTASETRLCTEKGKDVEELSERKSTKAQQAEDPTSLPPTHMTSGIYPPSH